MHQWLVLGTFAFCMLAILRLVEVGMWNEAAVLVIAVAGFMLDRAHMLSKEESEDDDEG